MPTRGYLHRIGKRDSGGCICGEEEDIQHFMLHCNRWNEQRQDLIQMVRDRGREVEPEGDGRIGQMIGMEGDMGIEERRKIGRKVLEMWNERQEQLD